MDEITYQIIKYSIPPIANLAFRIFGLGYNKKRLWIGLLIFFIMLIPVQFLMAWKLGYDTYTKYVAIFFSVVNVAVALIISCDNLKETLFYLAVQINATFYFSILCNSIKHLANLNYWQLDILEASVYLLATLLSLRFLVRPFRFLTQQLKTGWIRTFLIPVCVIAAGVMITTYSGTYFGDKTLFYLSVVTLIEFSFFLFLSSLYKNLRVIYEQNKDKLSASLLKAEIQSYNSSLEAARINRHDLKFHNSLIKEMLDKDDIEGAKKYLAEYDSVIDEGKPDNYCDNSTVNALFRIYNRKFSSKNISFRAEASVSDDINLPSPALVSILSNLLENAYETCKKIPEIKPHVTFRVREIEDSLEIEARNTSTEIRTLSAEGIPYTTKHGGGTGLRSVKNEVVGCGGEMRIEQTEDEFIVQIIIGLTKKSDNQKDDKA